MKISELCESERPRERLFSAGAKALSNGELLAILLRTGTRSEGALELAGRLLAKAGGKLVNLSNMAPEVMCEVGGIGMNKASSVVAALELGRRFLAEAASKGEPVTDARGIYRLLIPYMKGLRHEECWVVFLNCSQYLLGAEKLTAGGQKATIIDKNEILRLAIEKRASLLILVHNHPSGNPRPSKADMENTKQLTVAAAAFDIDVLDHLIICDDCFYSFADNGVFRP